MNYELFDKKNIGAMIFIFMAIALNIGFQLFFIPNIDTSLSIPFLILITKYTIPLLIMIIAFILYKKFRFQTLIITIILGVFETFDFLAVSAQFMNQFYNYVAAIFKDSLLPTKTFHSFAIFFWGMVRIIILSFLVKSVVILRKNNKIT